MRLHARLTVPLVAAAAAVAIGGCSDPYAATTALTSTTPTHPVAVAQRTHELPDPTKPSPPVGGAPSAEQAIRQFAERSVNWTWQTLAHQEAQLAAGASGQARKQAQVLSTTATLDTEMRRGRITSTGTVQAITPSPTAARTWVVVTLEQPGSDNDRAYEKVRAAYHVYLARAIEASPGRWAVSTWRPQV
ncbi:MAG TPA: hypothetical protein VGM91_19245 [Conexibacter sp.]|jgi:type IV pilus biogenesis protein CpaD/CtpE